MTETIAQEAVHCNETYVLRQASIQDIPQILSLYKSTWEPFAETNKSIRDYFEYVLNDLENLDMNYLAPYLTTPNSNFWVVTSYPEIPAQILGFVGVCPCETNIKAMELVRLVVAPEVRRCRVASRLLEKVETFSRQQSGCEFLVVTTATFLGPGALKFYTHNGFRETKRTDDKDIVLVEFTKSLIIGSWLKYYRQSAKIFNNLLIIDDCQMIDVTIPETYDEELPEFGDIPGHTKQSWEDINKYFLGLHSYGIANINGKPTSLDDLNVICDYCNSSESLWMHHCDECDKNMCNLCWKEKTEEIAIRNGSQHWSDRKDALLTCFQHEKEGKFSIPEADIMCVCCDICDARTFNFDNLNIVKLGEWFCNRKDEKNICPECSTTEEGMRIIAQDESWKKCTIEANFVNNLPAFSTGFGSLLEWVPILVDAEEHHMMMYNIVPGSKNYHRTALVAVDDHGRLGYHIVDGELEEIVTKLNENIPHYREIKIKHGCSWETHYNAPIPYFMNLKGWEIYFG